MIEDIIFLLHVIVNKTIQITQLTQYYTKIKIQKQLTSLLLLPVCPQILN